MNIIVLSAHSILEHDDLRMFSDLGYDTFVPGAYTDPLNPAVEFGDSPFRPPIPGAKSHPELAALCHEQRVKHAELGDDVPYGIVDWAKADLHPDLIEWADVIIVNCFPHTWIGYQWDAIRHKRVIWRTIGQSSPALETEMAVYSRQGMEVVRYSPAERRGFEPLGTWAGETAIIRFCKYASDFGPWVGDTIAVGNVTQNLTERGDHCGLDFWERTTAWLPTKPAGLGSQRLPNGLGTLTYDGLRDYLAHLRAHLYMGTQPAAYTLSLMEAMLAGVPTVSMGPASMWMPALFEGHELVGRWSNDPAKATVLLKELLEDDGLAWHESGRMRQAGIALFDISVVGPQWVDYLGAP